MKPLIIVSALLLIVLSSCINHSQPVIQQPLPSQVDLMEKSPDSFLVSFETTKGKCVMKAVRDWAPLGVDRLYILAKSGYYNGCVIYRVGPTASYKGGFVVQFGLGNNEALNRAWEKATIKDEPAIRPHAKGSVNFARGGPNTRTLELAISLAPGKELDTVQYSGVVGFPTIAEVVEGMQVLESLNKQYGNSVFEHEDSLRKGRDYLDRVYPGLDRILSVSVTKKW